MSIETKIAYVAITQRGKALAKRLKMLLGTGDLFVSVKLQEEGLYPFKGSLKEQVGILFNEYEAIIFIMATGIVVRSIVPYIESKFTDPAILVMDEKGQHVISLLSGHIGGANMLANTISELLGSNPVITTATDVNGVTALDYIAKTVDGYIKDFRDTVKEINYLLAEGKPVGIYIEGDYKVNTRGLIVLDKEVSEVKTVHEKVRLDELEAVIYISHFKQPKIEHKRLVHVVPRDLVLGMGCKKDIPISHMLESFSTYMEKQGLAVEAIKRIGSIEIKQDEEAMHALARHLEVPFVTVTKEAILNVEECFAKSNFVKKNIGVYNVAEPVAYLLGGKLFIERQSYAGITFAMGLIQ